MAGKTARAWRAFEAGDLPAARLAFSESTRNGSKSSHPFIQQGLFALKIDDYPLACESLKRAREVEPDNPAPVFFLALAQELDCKREESRATIDELKEMSPHHQGITSLNLLLELRDGDPLPLLSKFGFGSPQEGESGGALSGQLLASLGMGDPDNLPAELSSSDYLLGPILLEVEKKLHALEIPSLERHPPLLPEDLTALKPEKRSLNEEISQLKNSFRAHKPLRKGKAAFERSYSLTDREKQTELLEQAARCLRLARKLDPWSFRVSYHLGETYIFLARGESGRPFNRFRLLQAQNCFLTSVEKEGVNPYLLFYLAYIQHLLGRVELAIKYYDEATAKFEKLPEAHYGKGQCNLLLGDETAAKRLMLKAVNSDLALAKERLNLFANLLREHGPEHFSQPLPSFSPEPEPKPETESEAEPESEPDPEPEET